MISLLLATRNLHKIQEIRSILSGRFRYLTLNDFPGAPPVIEDAPTFQGNARKKAVELSKWLTRNPSSLRSKIGDEKEALYVLADDSGLEVDALEGAPGVYSARFAAMDVQGAGNSPDSANNAKLLRLLKDVPLDKRTARFRCVIALTPVAGGDQVKRAVYAVADNLERRTELFEGTCEGCIQLQPSGKGGFGYDPLFVPEGHQNSFADLGDEVKNKLSHRAKAIEKLRQDLERRRSRF
jgi:XTP/dITP diphosphohydrolase